MKRVFKATYHEIHISASDLVAFIQAIHTERRVGTLTVSFGTGGVPCGMMIWKERVDSTTHQTTPLPSSDLAHIPV